MIGDLVDIAEDAEEVEQLLWPELLLVQIVDHEHTGRVVVHIGRRRRRTPSCIHAPSPSTAIRHETPWAYVVYWNVVSPATRVGHLFVFFNQIKQIVFYAIKHVFFLFLMIIPLQTEKNGYYCFLIFNYIKCK